jgi:uncharacterized protein YmfQ (DUF2313 family)
LKTHVGYQIVSYQTIAGNYVSRSRYVTTYVEIQTYARSADNYQRSTAGAATLRDVGYSDISYHDRAAEIAGDIAITVADYTACWTCGSACAGWSGDS